MIIMSCYVQEIGTTAALGTFRRQSINSRAVDSDACQVSVLMTRDGDASREPSLSWIHVQETRIDKAHSSEV